MSNLAVRTRPSRNLNHMAARKSITLRSLIDLVYPLHSNGFDVATIAPHLVSPETTQWQIVLRTTASSESIQTTLPPRKYLWVRRTSRRAYNHHMMKMRDTLGDFKAMPALVLFTSLISIAFCLSLIMH